MKHFTLDPHMVAAIGGAFYPDRPFDGDVSRTRRTRAASATS